MTTILIKAFHKSRKKIYPFIEAPVFIIGDEVLQVIDLVPVKYPVI